MSTIEWLLLAAGVTLLVYVALIVALVLRGRHLEARALARVIPDCLVLLRRLIGDERVPRRRKLALLALVVYLSIPVDLVPHLIPVVGQLDDVILAALALRYALRSGGPDMLGPTGALAHLPGRSTRARPPVHCSYPCDGGGRLSRSTTTASRELQESAQQPVSVPVELRILDHPRRGYVDTG